jgi:hypothetical protein
MQEGMQLPEGVDSGHPLVHSGHPFVQYTQPNFLGLSHAAPGAHPNNSMRGVLATLVVGLLVETLKAETRL